MATTSVAISQMPKLAIPNSTAELPIVVGVTNFSTTIGAINALNTKATIGLDKVQNLTPAEMPVSTAQATALDLKMDKSGTLPVAQVTGLTALLDAKLDKTGQIEQSQVNGLVPRLVAVETGPVAVARVTGFDPAVQAIIDAQPAAEQDVVQGVHAW